MDHAPFDEAAYLARYPDVARAVAAGTLSSGRTHFRHFGFNEGRRGSPLAMPATIELEKVSPIATLGGPPLATTPPVVVNPELIPAALRPMLEAVWHTSVPAREITCHLLRDVLVVGEGLVFDMAGRLVAASAHQTPAHDIERAALRVADYLRDGAGAAIDGTTLLCEKVGAANYGHWLLEMAPLAFLLRDRLRCDWFLRAPVIDGAPAMSAVIGASLDLLGIDPARVHRGTGAVPQRFGRLVLTSGFSRHGAYYSPLASAAFDAMAAAVPAEEGRRIWVSRVDTRRRLRDEEALCAALAARGWSIVSPGAMSLRRQIAVFKHATIVAGVAGAGLTNLGFALPSTRVVAFVPRRMPVVFFYLLAQMKGQSYAEVRCPQEHEHDGAFNWEGELLVGAEEALAHLDALLAD